MAVEAARDCLGQNSRRDIAALYFASTSAPFDDRQNAGIIAEALNVGGQAAALDVSGSLRAGTSALIAAAGAVALDQKPALVVAAEQRRTAAASPLELSSGGGRAAGLLGPDDGPRPLPAPPSAPGDFG